MRKIPVHLFLIFIGSFFLSACENADTTSSTYDLEGKWRVVAYTDHESNARITKSDQNTWADFNDGDVTMIFRQTDIGQGEIQGVNVTNTYHGRYNYTANGIIALTDIAWTKVGEPEWARRFHAIENAESYVRLNDTQLIIYYNKGNSSISLMKVN